MNKPLSEKPQTRKKKAQSTETAVDDPLLGLTQELQDLWRRFSQDQQTTFEQVANAGTAFIHDEKCAELHSRWQQFVSEEVLHRFLATPVGPLRQYHGKINGFMEALAGWQAASQAFITLMNQSMTQSLVDLQEEIRDQLAVGRPVESLFPLWIRLFEERSLTLFRSAAFMSAMHEMLNVKAALVKAQEGLMEDILKSAHVPTLHDMDELSREVYLLKKRIAALEQALKDRHGRKR